KVYQEDMDPACSATADYGHNPWLFFPAEASLCQQNDVPMGTTTSGNLFADIHNGTLPNASMVVPNDCNNAHSCALSVADAWLSPSTSVPPGPPRAQPRRLPQRRTPRPLQRRLRRRRPPQPQPRRQLRAPFLRREASSPRGSFGSAGRTTAT